VRAVQQAGQAHLHKVPQARMRHALRPPKENLQGMRRRKRGTGRREDAGRRTANPGNYLRRVQQACDARMQKLQKERMRRSFLQAGRHLRYVQHKEEEGGNDEVLAHCAAFVCMA
jgi:hypothetical protein